MAKKSLFYTQQPATKVTFSILSATKRWINATGDKTLKCEGITLTFHRLSDDISSLCSRYLPGDTSYHAISWFLQEGQPQITRHAGLLKKKKKQQKHLSDRNYRKAVTFQLNCLASAQVISRRSH